MCIVRVFFQQQSGIGLPSGKHTKNSGKSPFLMGKSTISMAIFNSFLYVYQGVCFKIGHGPNGT